MNDPTEQDIEEYAKELDRSVRTALFVLGLIDEEMYDTDYSVWIKDNIVKQPGSTSEDDDDDE